MLIRINMTQTELHSALSACSSMDDNEHDKGAVGGIWQDEVLLQVIEALRAAIATRRDNTSQPFEVGPAEFGMLCDAVEIYCTDPYDGEDPDRAAADMALAARLLALTTISVEG